MHQRSTYSVFQLCGIAVPSWIQIAKLQVIRSNISEAIAGDASSRADLMEMFQRSASQALSRGSLRADRIDRASTPLRRSGSLTSANRSEGQPNSQTRRVVFDGQL